MGKILEILQPLGRALMLPIAVLPIAGLMLRLSQPDLFDLAFAAAAADSIFANLGLLFGIGVAVGLAKDNNGAAGLAGAVCFLVATQGAKQLMATPDDLLAGVPDAYRAAVLAGFKTKAIGKLSVPIGILSGVICGQLYNRFHDLKLPDYLAFFGGRRFIPIIAGIAGLALAALFGLAWHGLDHGIDSFSRAILGSGAIGLFLYGLLNRILIVTGLHHILNNVAYFILGDFHGVRGDLNRFFAGDPSAGAFMAGVFPVMMFGLPAACLAMYHAAKAERKAAVGGMLLSMALTSLLTGVTEPVEFSFMFLAPLLYVLHAILTGLGYVLMDQLGVRLGFGFSAGLFDYLINFKLATRPLLLLPVGALYFALYYGLFRAFIAWFDLPTPGRETVAAEGLALSGRRDQDFLAALGGAANLVTVDACTTRLRLIIRDHGVINETSLRALGAKGLVRPSDTALQVVLGPIADQVAGEIRTAMAGAATKDIWTLLGGRSNVIESLTRGKRLLVTVRDASAVDEPGLRRLFPRGMVRTDQVSWQLLTC